MAEFQGELREQYAALGKFLALDEFGKQFADEGLILQPQEVSVIGFEAEAFLQHRQTEHLAVVEFGRRSGPGEQFSILGDNAGMDECIVYGAVKSAKGVFNGKGCKCHVDS